MKIDIKLTKDSTKALEASIKKLARGAVLVGIPNDSSKNRRSGEPITNAEIGYIHEFGSPVRHIPARPFLFPSIEQNKDKIAEYLKPAFKGIETSINLEKAGLESVNIVRGYITNSSNFVPLKESTIKARQRKRKSGQAGTKPLIDTGALRTSITYVVLKNG